MFLPKSWWLSGFAASAFERLDQHVAVEHVDAHRGQRHVRLPGHARRVPRFLQEAGDAIGFVHRHDAEALALFDRHFDRRQRHLRGLIEMEPQHLLVVHLVNVIAGEHHDILRLFADDRVEVLVDGVGGALVPLLADALLRRQDLDELAELFRHDGPSLPDVTAERERFVLRGDEDVAEPRVDAVAQHEIDDSVGAAEIHRRLGAVSRERSEPFARSTRQHDHKHVVAKHGG